jgi:uncharacterized membrane protein YgcG
MDRMVIAPGSTPESTAKSFATALHDQWGVGDVACNNGVLFLLSRDDRQVYISTGAGASGALDDAKLVGIIADMRPLLRKGEYDLAIEQAVVDIGLGLAGREPGHSEDWASGFDWIGMGFMAILLGAIALSIWCGACQRVHTWEVLPLHALTCVRAWPPSPPNPYSNPTCTHAHAFLRP